MRIPRGVRSSFARRIIRGVRIEAPPMAVSGHETFVALVREHGRMLVQISHAYGWTEEEQKVGWPWVLANLAVGYAVIPLGLWALALASRRWGASAAWQRLRDDVAGRGLARALQSVEEIAAFRREA